MAFDLTKLKPGDEVGIESDRTFVARRATTTIKAIHDDGVFELDSGDWFDQNGKCVWNPENRHIAEPTDEGRVAVLIESIRTDLDILGERALGMTLEHLKEFRKVTLAMLEHEVLWRLSAGSSRKLGTTPSEARILDGLRERGIVAIENGQYSFTDEGRKVYDAAEARRVAFLDNEHRKFLGQ